MHIASRFSSPSLAHSLIAVLLAAAVLCGVNEALAQGWILETADPSANIVGENSSIVLDPSGNPHVAYRDVTATDLRFSRKSAGVWTNEAVDASGNNTGLYTSVALDASGNTHVTYFDATPGDLRYARKVGNVWTIETADASANQVGLFTSLALDASGNPHVSYGDGSTTDLKYARKSGGVWTTEYADLSLSNNVSQYTSIAIDASGNPHVTYFDVTNTDLKYARKSGGIWTIEIADGSANAAGYYSSLELDASGNPHVSYLDGSNGDLKYARKSGGVWTIETADASANVVGAYSSLALDALGNPHVSYHDNTVTDLKYASKSGGVWTVERVDQGVQAGFHTSLALDALGNPHIGYQDQLNGDLKYAFIPSLIVGAPAGGVTWAVGSSQTISWSYTGGLGLDISDVFLSVDGGRTYDMIEDDVRDFSVTIRVPHSPTRFARIKVMQPSPFTVGRSDSFFTIDATISLAKFEATRTEAGTRLTWQTQPGPEADIRYRVERGIEGATFSTIAEGLDRVELIDPSSTSGSRYRLIAINGLGEEYALGETSVARALSADRDIIVYPNPASGPIEIVYRIPFDRSTELSIYDLSGRKVRTLVTGRQALGVQSTTWDRRDDAGNDVAAGIYFARLTSGDGFQATERVTIVR